MTYITLKKIDSLSIYLSKSFFFFHLKNINFVEDLKILAVNKPIKYI